VEGKGNFGFNAQTSEYGDLMEMGIVDPTKVTRFALQNAASVAGLMLTTAGMVAELPKDDKGGGGMGGMGGMGDMDMCPHNTSQPQRPGSSGPSLLNLGF